MIENMTMSMCASLEYCKGWNDAVGQFNRQLKAMLPETEPEMHNPADIDEICALRGRGGEAWHEARCDPLHDRSSFPPFSAHGPRHSA